MNARLTRLLLLVAGVGTVGTFFGHGMWAIGGKDKFVQLLTGSFDNVLGISVGTATGTTVVKAIGYVDVAVAVVLALATVGVFVAGGVLRRLATSPLVLALYAWGVVWGVLTAVSRVTASGEYLPPADGVLHWEMWDLIERAPNFAIPLVGLLLVRELRKHNVD